MNSYILEGFKLPDSQARDRQGILGRWPGRRKPNLEGSHPNLVTKVLHPKMYFAFSQLFMATIDLRVDY